MVVKRLITIFVAVFCCCHLRVLPKHDMCDLYLKCADVIGKILDKRGSTKNLIYGSDSSNKKALYALVNETLKYKDVINELIAKVPSKNFQAQIQNVNRNLVHVMIYELLLGPKGKIQGGGKVKRLLTEHLSELQTALTKLKIKHKAKENADLLPESLRNIIPIPRYVRVNTLKTTMKDALAHFTTQYPPQPPFFVIDSHIPDLIVLPPNIDLHQDSFILERKAIIQDKASCFPPFVLAPPENSLVIDACSAPGNKTSYLSALMKGTGTVFAFEKDTRRFNTLSKFMRLSGCSNVKTIHGNFLLASHKEYSKVEYVLVDPSCSGSGIVNRMENHLENEEQDSEGKEERLTALSKFQVEVLTHALSFPNVKKVVYSTCSIHREENEDVVNTILQKFPNFSLKKDILPTWHRRGLPLFEGAEGCVRTDAKEDNTQGFFVACFERNAFVPVVIVEEEKIAEGKEEEEEIKTEAIEEEDETVEQPSIQKRDREEDPKVNDKQKKKKRKKKNRKPITQ